MNRTTPKPAAKASKPEPVAIASIALDEDTQSRHATSAETVDDYAEAMTEGAKLPPIVLFVDPEGYHLADGFHRVRAADKVGMQTILAIVHKGSKHDAAVYACSANQTHGLPRTAADKRRAVSRMLSLEPDWSDRKIAEHVGVGHQLVGDCRRQLDDSSSSSKSDKPTARIGRDGKKRTPAPRTKPPVAVPVKSAPVDDDDLTATINASLARNPMLSGIAASKARPKKPASSVVAEVRDLPGEGFSIVWPDQSSIDLLPGDPAAPVEPFVAALLDHFHANPNPASELAVAATKQAMTLLAAVPATHSARAAAAYTVETWITCDKIGSGHPSEADQDEFVYRLVAWLAEKCVDAAGDT